MTDEEYENQKAAVDAETARRQAEADQQQAARIKPLTDLVTSPEWKAVSTALDALDDDAVPRDQRSAIDAVRSIMHNMPAALRLT